MWKDSIRYIVEIFDTTFLTIVEFRGTWLLPIPTIRIMQGPSVSANTSRVSNIESDNSQNVGLEDYNNIFDRIFPYFTTPSIKITLG